ncbi:hypothetical protein SDC9_111483 [bioreactor metagenome]|uniref:Uncharacterized protein n=1 Tax=bioreactor metagenome TaxID=1076179 RepID=A0A645BHE6_9ZZZZ
MFLGKFSGTAFHGFYRNVLPNTAPVAAVAHPTVNVYNMMREIPAHIAYSGYPVITVHHAAVNRITHLYIDEIIGIGHLVILAFIPVPVGGHINALIDIHRYIKL